MIILHLSDIHFGRDNSEYKVQGKFENKKQILEDLLVSIGQNTFKIDHIIVTGDVAWFGKKKDFDEALVWFRKLLSVTNLSGSDITFCPGNHDVNRAYGNYKTDLNYKDIDSIDRVYQYEHVHKMEAPLYNYDKFCEALGVVPYHYPKNDNWEASYAVGYKDIGLSNGEIFRIVSFNTSLLSFIKGYPDDQMLIGQPQVMELFKHNLIGEKRDYYTIALFHHAERFLHTNEICEYDYRSATLPLLRRYVDLVLCGHTETGGIPIVYKQKGGAEMLTGGSAYYSDDHANAYSLLIVPDKCPEGKEREILINPFTYSTDVGWHQNIQKPPPAGNSVITKTQPDFKSRLDYELVLSYDDQTFSVPMKCISVYTTKDNIATLDNSDDVCRNLDISCSVPTDKPGTANVSITIAHIKENSVESLLARESVFEFLNRTTNAQNGSSFKIVDTAGNVCFSGENISCNEKVEDECLEFLTRLRQIELEYDLIFQCPKDNAENMKVDILNDLIKHGYTTGFKAIVGLETYFSNKKDLFKISLLSLKKRSFYIMHKGEFRCRLYGNDFSLGNITVLMGPYTIKGSKALYKAITHTTGDKRKINLTLCSKSICYLISDEKKANIKELIKRMGEYIEVGNMNCVWDFIYEVNS